MIDAYDANDDGDHDEDHDEDGDLDEEIDGNLMMRMEKILVMRSDCDMMKMPC